MIIDCHGHYTTAPDALGEYRERQKAELAEDPLHRHVKGDIYGSPTTRSAKASKARNSGSSASAART